MTLITPEYLDQIEQHRASRPFWGNAGVRYQTTLYHIMRKDKAGIKSILDYGCGMGRLVKAWKDLNEGYDVRGYDPGVPEFSGLPEPADLVYTTDVLEHVEPECIDDVLEHIRSLTKKVGFHVPCCKPSGHTLPDGRNVHLIIETPEWWEAKLRTVFRRVVCIGHGGTKAKSAPSLPMFLCRP